MTHIALRAGALAAAVAVGLAASPAPAQTASDATGEWMHASEEDLSGAFTVNGSGSAFGLVCGQSCVAYVESSRTCRESAAYAGAMEGRSGAIPIRMTCRIVQGRYALTWRPDETFIQLVSAGGELKIVVPDEDGDAGIHLFSLRGAYEAIYAALRAAAAREEEADAAGAEQL